MKKIMSVLFMPILFLSIFGISTVTLQGLAGAEICTVQEGDSYVYKDLEGECPPPPPCDFTGDGGLGSGTILGFIPTWYKYLDGEVVSGKCRPVIAGPENALPIGLAVLEAMLSIAGLVAVVMIFIGSFKYVLSQGEPDRAKDARQTVINTVIGLVIVIIATRVVSFIAGSIG
jgi:Type IV secretion system pilin